MQVSHEYGDQYRRDFLTFLLDFVSENKRSKFQEVIRARTRHITVVLENIYQSHNASAVMRSCDCYGIQDLHIIEGRNPFSVNPDIALGASKWLTQYRYSGDNPTKECILNLKSQGYKVVCTSPHHDSCDLQSLPMDQKTALLFGTELDGLSDEAMSMADTSMKIPMFGFTESLNISVSAAICLFYLSQKIRDIGVEWKLTPGEITEVMTSWARSVVKNSDLLEKEFTGRWLKMNGHE